MFRAHNEAVIANIPPERLLVFRVQDGWQPLCDFLGVPVPDEPFPHVNDTAEMKNRIKVVQAIGFLPYTIAVVLLAYLFM